MEKTKLLTSICAFALVIGLGACDKTTNDDATGSEENTDSDSSSSEPIPPQTINNLTISISFTDEQDYPVSIPDYGCAYIVGSFDSWETFIPLTIQEGVYSTTFEEIEVGSYEYKVVMWYTDYTVSWSDCVEITSENQTLEVTKDDEGKTLNYSYLLSASLEELGQVEGEEALDITLGILNKIPHNIWLEEYSWNCVYVQEEDPYYDNEEQTIYLNRSFDEDEEEILYGIAIYKDDDGETYNFYKQGVYYEVQLDEDGEIDDFDIWQAAEDFEYWITEFSDPLQDAEDLVDYIEEEDEDISFTLTRNPHTYDLVVTIEEEAKYTYTASKDYTLTSIGYDDFDGYVYTAQESTLDVIQYKFEEYKSLIGICFEPSDLLSKIASDCNYYLSFEFEEELSEESVTYSEYQEAYQKALMGDRTDYYAIIDKLGDSFEYVQDYIVDIYYTQEALLIEYYEYGEYQLGNQTLYYPYYQGSELIVNSQIDGEDVFFDYWSEDGESWHLGVYDDYGNYLYDAIYSGCWQDYFYSLADAYELGIGDNLSLYFYSDYYGGYTGWSLDDESLEAALFICLGGQFLFGDAYNEYLSTYLIYNMTYFFPYYEEMDFEYYLQQFVYFGEELTDDTDIYLDWLYVYVEIWDAGEIDLSDEIEAALEN